MGAYGGAFRLGPLTGCRHDNAEPILYRLWIYLVLTALLFLVPCQSSVFLQRACFPLVYTRLDAAPMIFVFAFFRLLENILILVPPAIELVFTLTLAFTDTSVRGRKRWLLVLDGVSFFLLALADFLAHVLTQANSTVHIFKIIDLVVAGASFLPIFSYTLFLFLFARSNLVKLLPTRFGRVITFSLFAIIPPIIAFNELSSLLGITHKTFETPNHTPVLAVGFSNTTFQRLALFFSSGALALLTLFQAALFSLAFLRVVRAFLDERRIESDREKPNAPEEIHLFRGLGWLTVGLKLGAIETVVGFANVSFAVVITRRVLRLFGRGALIIGVIKGLNVVEDFVKFETDVRARRGNSRRSKRFSRFMISNPRNSTFREMSPQASSFHAAQRQKRAGRLGPSPLAFDTSSSFGRKERVTVQYDGKTPPILQLRFSALDIDVPPLPQKVSLPVVMEDPREDARSIYSTVPSLQASRNTLNPHYDVALASGSNNTLPHSNPPMRPMQSMRTGSQVSDSLEAVREIAARFPNLPPRIVPGKPPLMQQPADTDPDEDWRAVARSRSLQRRQELQQHESAIEIASPASSSVSPGNSIKRKPAPASGSPVQDSPPKVTVESGYVTEPKDTIADDDGVSLYSSDERDYSMRTTRSQTPDLTRVSTFEATPTTPPAFAMLGTASERSPGRLANRVMAIENKIAQSKQAEADTLEEARRRRLSQLRRELRAHGADEENHKEEQEDVIEQEIEVPWMRNDALTELQAFSRPGYPLAPSDIDDEDISEAVLDEAWRRAGLTRIKTVSRVRVHTTPRAEQTFDVRGSLFAVEEEDLGFPESPEEPRSVSVGSARLVKPARLDSGVLGEEDKKLVRQGLYI